jgi:hypothetical protein
MGHHVRVPRFSRLAANARRLAASRWTGVLLTFATFQWIWESLVVSLCAATLLALVLVALARTRWARTKAEADANYEQGAEALLGMLFWTYVWLFHGIEHRPAQTAWALISAAIFLLHAFVAFLDWRVNVANDRQDFADMDGPRANDTPITGGVVGSGVSGLRGLRAAPRTEVSPIDTWLRAPQPNPIRSGNGDNPTEPSVAP